MKALQISTIFGRTLEDLSARIMPLSARKSSLATSYGNPPIKRDCVDGDLVQALCRVGIGQIRQEGHIIYYRLRNVPQKHVRSWNSSCRPRACRYRRGRASPLTNSKYSFHRPQIELSCFPSEIFFGQPFFTIMQGNVKVNSN